MTLQLVRSIRGHWATNEAAPTWLADVVLDLSVFEPAILTTTFTGHAVVLAGGTGICFLATGGQQSVRYTRKHGKDPFWLSLAHCESIQ